MNIVYDDIIYSLQKCGGGSVYWSEVTQNKTKNEILRIVYDTAKKNKLYAETLLEQSVVKSSAFLQITRFLPIKIKKWKNDSFIFHSSYYRYSNSKNACNIATIHDFTDEIYGKGILSLIRKFRKKRTISHSKGIICISNNTLEDFKYYYPKYKGEVVVIHNGYDRGSYYLMPNSTKRKNILFVGARGGYKRFDLAVKIASKFCDSQLVIVGGGDLNEPETELLDRLLKDRYKKIGFISNDELRNLYNEAFFLCYPSEYEGFGIPIVEAQACGCPVVCQQKSCIPEIGGDSVVYFAETEIDSSDCEIYKLNIASYYEQKVYAGLSNAKKYSWDKTRKETLDFYTKVLYGMGKK